MSLPPPPPAYVLHEPYPVPPAAPVITPRVELPAELRERRMEALPMPRSRPVSRQVAEMLARVALSGLAHGGGFLIAQEDLHPERPKTPVPGFHEPARRWVMREGPWAPVPYPTPGQR